MFFNILKIVGLIKICSSKYLQYVSTHKPVLFTNIWTPRGESGGAGGGGGGGMNWEIGIDIHTLICIK